MDDPLYRTLSTRKFLQLCTNYYRRVQQFLFVHQQLHNCFQPLLSDSSRVKTFPDHETGLGNCHTAQSYTKQNHLNCSCGVTVTMTTLTQYWMLITQSAYTHTQPMKIQLQLTTCNSKKITFRWSRNNLIETTRQHITRFFTKSVFNYSCQYNKLMNCEQIPNQFWLNIISYK